LRLLPVAAGRRELAEHWPVVDTYRILVAIGAIPPAANAFQQILGVDESPGGLFPERRGTEFAGPERRPITREESRAVVRRLYNGVIATGARTTSMSSPRATSRTRAGLRMAGPPLPAR